MLVGRVRGRYGRNLGAGAVDAKDAEIKRLLAHIRHLDGKIIELHRELYAMDECNAIQSNGDR